MSSFFTLPASRRKRKRTDGTSGPGSKRRGITTNGETGHSTQRKNRDRDESISGSGSESDDDVVNEGEAPATETEASDSASEEENAADRRLRLAERYLENIREEVDEVGFDAEEIDRDLIAQRLKEDVDEVKGRQYRQIASKLDFSNATHAFFRADTKSTTGVAIHEPFVYTVHKDTAIIKWEIPPPLQPSSSSSSTPPQTNGTSKPVKHPRPLRRTPKQLLYTRGVRIKASTTGGSHGHTSPILSLAISPSGTYLATGGASDKRLIIWSAATLTPLKTFTTHRDSVLSLSFTPSLSTSTTPTPNNSGGEQLFSASADRTIKSYNLSLPGPTSLAYVETLFGHQDPIPGIAAMGPDTCVSVGSRDRTARLWKVVEEQQLVFRSGSSRQKYVSGSVDCVAAIPPAHFITGSDSGNLELWNVNRKKALFTIESAHGVDEPPSLEALSSETDIEVVRQRREAMRPTPRWITALAAVPGTDVVLSGSWDGHVRAWKLSADKRSIEAMGVVGSVSDPGSANDLESVYDRGNTNGIINSIAVFERRKTRKTATGESEKSGATEGLCIVAGVGQEHRLGTWMRRRKEDGVRNGAVLFEVRIKEDEAEEDEEGEGEEEIQADDEEQTR